MSAHYVPSDLHTSALQAAVGSYYHPHFTAVEADREVMSLAPGQTAGTAELEFQPGVSTPEPCSYRPVLPPVLKASVWARSRLCRLPCQVGLWKSALWLLEADIAEDFVSSVAVPVRKSGLCCGHRWFAPCSVRDSSFPGKGSIQKQLLTPVAN